MLTSILCLSCYHFGQIQNVQIEETVPRDFNHILFLFRSLRITVLRSWYKFHGRQCKETETAQFNTLFKVLDG